MRARTEGRTVKYRQERGQHQVSSGMTSVHSPPLNKPRKTQQSQPTPTPARGSQPSSSSVFAWASSCSACRDVCFASILSPVLVRNLGKIICICTETLFQLYPETGSVNVHPVECPGLGGKSTGFKAHLQHFPALCPSIDCLTSRASVS